MSLGLVSYCFASKEELTIAMATRLVQELADAGDVSGPRSPSQAELPSHADIPSHANEAHPVDDAEQRVRAVLRQALRGLWAEVERTPRRQLLTYEITTRSLREPGLGGVAQQQYTVTVAAAAEVLAMVARTAEVSWARELDDLAGLVVMAIDGATLRWLVDQDSGAAVARLGDIADLLATMTS